MIHNYRRYFSRTMKQKGPEKVPCSYQKMNFVLSKVGVNSQNEELVEIVQNNGHMPWYLVPIKSSISFRFAYIWEYILFRTGQNYDLANYDKKNKRYNPYCQFLNTKTF